MKRFLLSRYTQSNRYIKWAMIVAFLSTTVGCLPDAPPLDGKLSFDDASGLLFEMHHNHGKIYKKDLEYNGKAFKAEWELANFLKKSAQLQVKPKVAEFDEIDLCMALQIALADEETNPWHNVADDAIMDCFLKALHDEDTHIASGICPDAPYDITVKVKKYSTDWFCEVRIRNLLDPKKVEEGAKFAEEQLDRLEQQHADD